MVFSKLKSDISIIWSTALGDLAAGTPKVKVLTTAFGNLTKGVSGFTKAAIAAVAIFAAFKLIDHFIVTTEEAIEKHDELAAKYRETASEVSAVESELKTMKDRLEELNKMDPASITDPEEKGRLEEEIRLLDEKLKMLQKLEAHEKHEAAEAAAEALTKSSLYLAGSATGPDGVAPIFGTRTIVEEYQQNLQKLTDLQNQLNAATAELYSLDPSKSAYTKQRDVVESLRNAVDTYDKSVTNTRLDILALYESIKDDPAYTDLAAEVAVVLELDAESADGTVSKVEGVAGQISDTLGGAVGNVFTDEAKEALNKQIDDFQSSMSTLSSALENLQSGELDFDDVIDLMQQFPELAPYVDLTAENFGDLADGLKKAIKSRPDALIKDLKELATTGELTEDAAKAVDGFIRYLENIPTSGVENVTEEFGVLKKAIDDAASAHTELEKKLAEPDYDEGYNNRVEAFDAFKETHKAGEYGSKAYTAYKEYFGLEDMTTDQIEAWIKANNKYFSEGTKGIKNFLKTIDSLDNPGKKLEGIASFDSKTGEFWYDINRLDEFADALGWSTEMLQDFIDKYRMYCEEWTARDAQDNLTEFTNAGLISESNGWMIADLERLMEYTNLSKDKVLELIAAINELRKLQGLEPVRIVDPEVDVEKVQANVEAAKKNIEENTESGKIIFESEVRRPDPEEVEINVPLTVDGEEAVTNIKVASSKIEEILGGGWQAKLSSEDAEKRMAVLQALCDGLTDDEYEIDLDDNAKSVIENLKDLLFYLKYVQNNSIQTIEIRYKETGKKPGVGGEYYTPYASGTQHAKDGPALLGDEYSPNGTPKPELVVSDGEAYIAGANGPEIRELDAGDVVYTADETKKILGGRSVDRVIPAHAGGTASGLVGGGSGGSSGSSGGSKKPTVGDTKKPDTNTFEDLYAYHQHLLELDRESLEDYLNWLSDAYKKAYKNGEIELQDYYNYEAEIFQGLQDLHNNYIQDVEHQIFLMEKRGASADEIIALYKQMMDAAHAEAERLRAEGLDENSDIIQSLQEQWWEYHDAIIEIQEDAAEKAADAYAAAIQDVEHQIFLLGQHEGTNDEIIALYKQMMDMAHEEAERLRAAGYDDSSDEIQELQKQWWEYYNAIADLEEEAAENAKSVSEELIEYRIDMLKHELEEQKDALNEQLDQLKDFYDKQKDMLREKYDEEKYLEEQAEKRKNVSDLEAELAQLRFDDSGWAQKRRAELDAELADAQKDLSDFEEEKALEDAEKLLDEQFEKQEALIQTQIEAIEAQLNDPEALFNKALADIQNNTAELYQEMVEFNASNGSGNPDDVREMWEEAYAALEEYLRLFGEAYKGIVIDSGWAEEAGITGYATGTRHATAGVHQYGERGDEVIFTSADGSKYRIFSDGEKVLNASATEFLYDFANSHGNSMKSVWDSLVGSILQQVHGIGARETNVEISTGDIVIQGNTDDRTISEIRRSQRDQMSYILKEFNKLR